MKRADLIILCLPLFFAIPAFGHDMHLSAEAVGSKMQGTLKADTIPIEGGIIAFFDAGEKSDPKNSRLERTVSDAEGRFAFSIPEGKTAFKITAETADGHYAETTIDLQKTTAVVKTGPRTLIGFAGSVLLIFAIFGLLLFIKRRRGGCCGGRT